VKESKQAISLEDKKTGQNASEDVQTLRRTAGKRTAPGGQNYHTKEKGRSDKKKQSRGEKRRN